MTGYYYITGPDGCGKTTILELLKKEYQAKSIEPLYIWLRSPKIVSKPLMLFCRIIGLTKYKNINGVRYGSHEFYRSKFISWLFPILQLVDFKIKWAFLKKKIIGQKIVLFDRFSLDTLADIMADTYRFDLHKTKLGKKFLKIIPVNTKTIVLEVDESLIRNRKEDTRFDPKLQTKIKVYNILAKDLKLKVINNNKPLINVKTELFKYLRLDGWN